jgi:hypothetical protein
MKANVAIYPAVTTAILTAAEHIGDRILQRARTVSVKRKIDIFQAPNQAKDFPTRDGSAGSGAKVRAATERPIFVDQAVASILLKHWARAISIFRERFSAGCAKGHGRDDRLAFRQIRSASSQFEMTAFRFSHAIPLDRLLRKIDINLSHLR